MPYIKIDKNFIDNFINPISKMTQKAVIEVHPNKVTCLAVSPDGLVIGYFAKAIETDLKEMVSLNIGDLIKLKNHLLNATDLDDNDQLLIEGNKLKYKSSKWRFTLHLFDDGIIAKNRMPLERITDFEYTTKFVLTYDNVREIVRMKAANKDSEKVYFKFDKEGVYVDVTDYTIENTDETGMRICEDFKGEINIVGCPLYFEIFKILSQNKNIDYTVKHHKKGVFLLQTAVDGCVMNYLMSEIIN